MLLFALAACSERTALETIAPADDKALSAQVIADLQGRPGADADLAALIDPQLRDKLGPALPKMRAALPSGRSRLVDASVQESFSGNGQSSRRSYLAYEVDGAKNARALVRIWITREGGSAQIDSLYVNPLDRPVEQVSAFTLSDKSPVQYAILALAVLSPLTILFSEVLLFLTKGIRLKWLWAVACLFGVGQVSVDWSSGAVGFMPISFNLLGAFVVKAGALSAWRVGFALPAASIAFLALRRRLQKPPQDSGGMSASGA